MLGHWGTCHGINVAYANLRAWFSKDEQVSRTTKLDQTAKPINPFAVGAKLVETTDQEQDTSVVDPNFSFILGPGHGFPALQANLFIDGDLEKVDPKATRNAAGIAYVCRNFLGQMVFRPTLAHLRLGSSAKAVSLATLLVRLMAMFWAIPSVRLL